jgi:hypothetical protein
VGQALVRQLAEHYRPSKRSVTPVNPNDEVLAALRERHPRWQIWRVDRFLGRPVWCARPVGQTQPVFNATSPERLNELIEEQEAAPPPAAGSGAGPSHRLVAAAR